MVYSVKSFLQIKKNTNDTVVVIKATVNIVNYTWKMKWRERGGEEGEGEVERERGATIIWKSFPHYINEKI